MKNRKNKNSNGVVISDSIIMSVKKKRPNLRALEAVIIALCGFVSTIMAFFSMFSFNYSRPAVIFAAIFFSAVYITLALLGKKGIWIAAGSVFVALFACLRYMERLALGYKYIYNAVYSAAYHTNISYYKSMKPLLEEKCVTAFFILFIWALAIIIYTFTIYRPNSFPPLIITFPVLEIGLYNGMKVSVLWGMMLVAYWFALFAMTAIDMGEYSGGSSGFVRKENLFFPKRQMRLKVTEKCGMMIITEVILITLLTSGTMKLLGYKRSDEINQRRIKVRDAVNSFTIDDLAGSVSNITSAFGFTFNYDTHKLGNVDRLRYKDTTDLTVTIDKEYSGAIYLKEFTGSVYEPDKWTALPDSAFDNELFSDFKTYSVYPQDFPHTFDHVLFPDNEDYTIWINSKVRSNRSFAPYGTDSLGILDYNYDREVTSKKNSKNEFSYKFAPYSPDNVIPRLFGVNRRVFFPEDISDPEWRDLVTKYCRDRSLIRDDQDFIAFDTALDPSPEYIYSYPDVLLAMALEKQYEDFVYKNYLQLPDTPEIKEIRQKFAPLIDGKNTATASAKMLVLDALREEVFRMAQYSLNPGRTPNNRDFVNYFLFENHKGYCTHFASAGVLLARMAGIPARYATGYVLVGDDFNSDNRNASGSYTIQVKDNRSHAWVEIYLDGYGWVPYEFTAGYSQQSIDTTPSTSAETTTSAPSTTTTAVDETTTTADTTGTKKSHGTTTRPATTLASTSATTTATGKNGNGNGSGGGHKLTIPPAVKYTIYTVLLAAAFIGAVLLRRLLILKIRRRHFTGGDSRSRMRYIYGFTEKLLGIAGITQENESRADFARKVDTALGGRLFPSGGFTECTDAALRAAFSDDVPDKSETDRHMKFAEDFAKKLYDSSKPLRKLWLRFINVIQ